MTITQKKTACPRDCPDACGLIATIDSGKVVRLQGDPDHPVTQGFICHRTSQYPKLINSDRRLKQPLYRANKDDEFQPIDWPTALDLVADHMLKFRTESSAASILNYRCGGSMGMLTMVTDFFFERFGPVTTKSGDVCSGAGEAAQEIDFGLCDSNDFFDAQNSKTIFIWGKNLFAASIHLIPQIKKAKANGTKIVVIDPVHNRTASLADVYVQPKPGSDYAIALGICRWLFENNHSDSNAATYCDNFDEFKQVVFSLSLEQWAALAELSIETLCSLAEDFANGPTCSMIGWGMQRRKFGAASVRCIDALATVSGNVGIAGGGAGFYCARRSAYDDTFTGRIDPARTIPEPLLGQGILDACDPPIRMAYIWAANPVPMLPDSETVAKALRQTEFTVVVDPLMTDTGSCANLVLPTTSFLEEEDFIGAYGHHYLAKLKPVVDAPDGILTDYEITRELSKRVGLGEEFDLSLQVWKDRMLTKLNSAGITEDDFEGGYPRNPFTPEIMFQDRKFPTASGRVNLICSLDAKLLTTDHDRRPKVTAVSTMKCQGSQWQAEEQVGPATVTTHPDTFPNQSDGDIVWLSTECGKLQVKLKFDNQQRTDILLMDKGGWHNSGRSANSLIKAELTDDGECAVYYDTPAELIKSPAKK